MEKSIVFLRSSVIVTEDMTASYLPLSRPAKMPSHAVFLNSTVNPPALAAAFIRSMSKPTMFLFLSTISMGGKVASEAIDDLGRLLLGAGHHAEKKDGQHKTDENLLEHKLLLRCMFIPYPRSQSHVKKREVTKRPLPAAGPVGS